MFTTATKFLQPVTSIMIAIQAEEMPCRQRRCNAGKSKCNAGKGTCNAGNLNAMQAKSNTMQAKVNAMQAKVYAKQAKINTMQELGKQGGEHTSTASGSRCSWRTSGPWLPKAARYSPVKGSVLTKSVLSRLYFIVFRDPSPSPCPEHRQPLSASWHQLECTWSMLHCTCKLEK
jgi:hypothetical protein